jgi:hypothetical protein
MHELQQKEFHRALSFIGSLKCKYIVIDESKNKYTNVVDEKEVNGKKRSASYYPKGELINHVKKHINEIQIGEVRSIPMGSFDLARISSCATSYMSTTYGNKSYTSHRAKDAVEIMRIY